VRRFLLSAATLWQRELVRFFRQRSRVVGALGPPILFWFLIGSGLSGSFRLNALQHVSSRPSSSAVVSRGSTLVNVNLGPPSATKSLADNRRPPRPSWRALEPAADDGIEGVTESHAARAASATYLQYFFPGTIALIILFTAIFSTISIIEDRHEGFLQSVLVAPMSREGLVLGKMMGGTTLAFGQALLFLCIAPVIHISISLSGLLLILVMLALVSFSLTGLGFWLAWKLDSTQGFHAIMNLFLIPMWLLSGALFPVQSAPFWLRVIMRLNPLTYGLSTLQSSFYVAGQPLSPPIASPGICVACAAGFGVLLFVICVRSVRES